MSNRRRYRVLATVGRGGMGTVYHARLHGTGDFEKDVAIKLLNDEEFDDPDDIARRLRDEARILGLIRHRAVVTVDGLMRLSGRWAVVMEYVDGVDIREVIQFLGSMPVSAALGVVSEVGGALHVATHCAGPDGRELNLLHRDIKPANIRISTAGEVKVLDFGVAKGDFDTREAETKHMSFGSLGYVPQERIDGIDLPAGDIYSLGVVLLEMLSGKVYGQTHLSPRRHDQKVEERLETLVDKGVPRLVRTLIKDMMAFDPAERPSARDVERRATKLRGEVPGMLLRDWAEAHVPDLMERAREGMGESGLTGQILEEDTGTPAPGRRSSSDDAGGTSTVQTLLAGGIVVLLVVLVLGGLLTAVLGGIMLGRVF